MPIEIKELIIRARVESHGNTKKSTEANSKQKQKVDPELVEECVEQVLEILRRQKER